MSGLEERVRDAYRAADSWGPDVPPPLPAAPRARRRGRVLVPLGAAVAVGAVVAGAVVVGDGEPERTPPRPAGPVATPYVVMSVGKGLSVVDSRTGLAPHGPATLPGKADQARTGYHAVTRDAGTGGYLTGVSTLIRPPTRRLPPKFSSRVHRVAVTAGGRAKIGPSLDWTVPGVLLEMALSPDGRRLAYFRAMDEGGPRLGVLDLASLRQSEWPVGSGGTPLTGLGAAWRPDGREVIFTLRNAVRGLDPATGRERTLVPGAGAPGRVESAVPDADGLVVAVANGKKVRLFRYREGRWSGPPVTLPSCGGVTMLTYAGDGRTLLAGRDAAACADPTSRLYAVRDGHVRRLLKSNGTFRSAAW
ncbi:hypothetical protein ACIBF1_00765 [Spirillospora sp. NPDC050679]